MKVALITPQYVRRPTIGFQLRLYQLQAILERIAPGRVLYWSTRLGAPVDAGAPPDRGEGARPSAARGGLPAALRNLATLGLHLWPRFVVSSLGAQRGPLLAWVDRERPTHVVVCHPEATELVPALVSRGIQVFVDCMNVDSDLTRQMIPLVSPRSEQIAWVLRWRAIRRKERRLFPLATEVWLPSGLDAERQARVCAGRARIRALPNVLDVASYAPRQGAGSHDILLAGDFGYAPNVVGARLLRDRVLPEVRRLVPEARLILVGRDQYGHARALERSPDVVVTGEVPDTRPYLREAGVVAVPILHGGGTRYKILEALAVGLPVVSTPLGAEGLDVRDGAHLLLRDVDDFADAIVSVLRDPSWGMELGRNGRRLVESSYSLEAAERIVRASIAQTPASGTDRPWPLGAAGRADARERP